MKRTRVAGLSVGLCVAISGCGGGDGLSRAELIKKVDPVCKRHNATITVAASKVIAGGKVPRPAAFIKLAKETIFPEYSAQIDALSKLKPSSDLAGNYEAWLGDSRATAMRVKRNPAILTTPATFERVNGEAKALGFTCNVGPS